MTRVAIGKEQQRITFYAGKLYTVH